MHCACELVENGLIFEFESLHINVWWYLGICLCESDSIFLTSFLLQLNNLLATLVKALF